jgi:DNA-binding MarR family transcriptional regulator
MPTFAKTSRHVEDTFTQSKNRRFQSKLGRETPRRIPLAETVEIGRDELAFLAEGLAYGPRALLSATRNVTARYDLGPRGAWIVNVISHGITYPLELATTFGVGRSLITAELARLVEAGLIASRPSDSDRRKTELTLTPLGEAASQEVRAEFVNIVNTRLSGFSPEELRLASEVLRALSYDENESPEGR